MTEIERFRETVETFIARTGMSPTAFGRQYASDPRFVFDLRKGREPRTEARQRILADLSARSTPKETTA